MSKISQWLLESRVKGIDVDDDRLLEVHEQILREKSLLRSAFLTLYNRLSGLCDTYLAGGGLEIELGSGAGFFKEIRPNLITSDIRKSPRIDMVLNAMHMELPDESVRCMYAINVFHHLPSPDVFFHELSRVLIGGGGIIIVEPHGGLFSAWLHKRLHKNEYFDPAEQSWETSISGPMSGANQALAHIVFERDKKIFLEKYGSQFEIVKTCYALNALRYLLSGGLNFRQLVPGFVERPLQFLEHTAKPFARYWSLHKIIVLKKCEPQS